MKLLGYAALAVVLTGNAALADCPPPPGAGAIISELAASTNKERERHGLSALPISRALTMAAQSQACVMADLGVLAHEPKGKPGFRARLKRAGYRISTAVENIGRSDEYSAASPYRMWKNSPLHAANTVNPDIREMGFGIARSGGKTYYVFVGGRSR